MSLTAHGQPHSIASFQIMDLNSTPRNSGAVQSVDRALLILRLFAAHRADLDLAEVSQGVGLPKSTCHRLLAALEQNGFVATAGRGRYRLGLVAAQVGEVAINQLRPGPAVRAHLHALSEETGETVGLTVLQGQDALVIDRVESTAPLRMQYGIGTLLPAHASASGKVLLAFSTGRERLVAALTLDAYTATTVTSRERLLAELDEIRRRGYAVDREELYLGLVCLATPVLDRFGEAVAALGVSGPSVRVVPERFQALGEALDRRARAIARYLDGTPVAARARERRKVA